MKVLFDTNIFIDHFNGYTEATDELEWYDDAAISAVSWIEVACTYDAARRGAFNEYLNATGIAVIHTNDAMMVRTSELRGQLVKEKPKKYLCDMMIRATAEVDGRTVITRNPDDFGNGFMTRVPYQIVDGKVINVQPRLP